MSVFQWNSLQDLFAIQEKMNRLFEDTIHRTEFPDEGVEVVDARTPELVHERAEEARRRLAELSHQIGSAACPVNCFSAIAEDALDLFVQLVAIREDEDARIGIVFQNPPRQQHHHDAFAAALGVPDDSALVGSCMFLRRLDPEILMGAGQLFNPAIEEDEVPQ